MRPHDADPAPRARPCGRRRLVRAAAVVVIAGALGGALGVLLGVAAPSPHASAQSEEDNSLLSSEPANGATVGSSPSVLTFQFSQEFGEDDKFTAPVACGTEPQNTGVPEVGDDGQSVTVEVLTPFPRGACVVSWRLVDGLDQEITSGTITFSVENAPPSVATTAPASGSTTATTAPPPADASSSQDGDGGSVGGALWLGRVLSALGILVVFGSMVLIATAWPEGTEYVVTVRFLRSMWVLALVGTLLFVVALRADETGESFGASLSPGSWFDLWDAGASGQAALARLVLVIAMAWVVLRPERVIDPTTQLAAFGIAALAVVTLGFGRTDGNLPALGVAVAIAHAFAVAVWFGGVVLVARVVLAGPGDEDLVHAVRGFSRLSVPAILVTVGTGVLQVIRLVGGALFTSDHGRVMLLKAIAVAAMVFVAVTTRQVVAARLDRAREMTVPLADRFRRAFGAEAVIGVVVLALTGWLLGLTPAQVDESPAGSYAVSRTFTDDASGLDVIVRIGPSEVGLNALRVEVHAPEQGVSGLVVSFLPPEGTTARGIDQPIALNGAGAAVLDRSVGIPLDVAGTWTMQVSANTSTGSVAGAQNTFAVTEGDEPAAATTTTTAPVVTVIVDPNAPTTTVAAG